MLTSHGEKVFGLVGFSLVLCNYVGHFQISLGEVVEIGMHGSPWFCTIMFEIFLSSFEKCWSTSRQQGSLQFNDPPPPEEERLLEVSCSDLGTDHHSHEKGFQEEIRRRKNLEEIQKWWLGSDLGTDNYSHKACPHHHSGYGIDGKGF